MSINYQFEYQNGFHVWYRPSEMPYMPQHLHRNVEIIYLKAGASSCTVDLVPYELRPGDVLFVFSEQLHSYAPPTGIPENYALLFPPDIPVFKEIFDTMLPTCPILHGVVTEEIEALFHAARSAYNADKNGDRFAAGAAQGYISIILSKLLPQLPMQKKSQLRDNLEHRLIRYCAAHYTEPITLESVAKEFGYSPAYLSRFFKSKFKVGFSRFITHLRLEEAKKMVRSEGNMTEVAYACGFGSMRNFNRAFKESVDMTPSEYRKSKR